MSIAKDSKRIGKVTVKRIPDYDNDLSYLGEYSDDSASEFTIVAIGEHEGEFLADLEETCECGNLQDTHIETEEGYAPCSAQGCNCEDFDQVTIERGRTYRYFNSASVEEDNSNEDNRTYAMQDYKRMKAYNDGEWMNYGVKAEARILIGSTVQVIHSGGLWGIESDSEESYFTETEEEQLVELKTQLHAIGFSKRAITAAFRNIERKSD